MLIPEGKSSFMLGCKNSTVCSQAKKNLILTWFKFESERFSVHKFLSHMICSTVNGSTSAYLLQPAGAGMQSDRIKANPCELTRLLKINLSNWS